MLTFRKGESGKKGKSWDRTQQSLKKKSQGKKPTKKHGR